MTEPIKIDIWSDIACPWCYIGKRNFQQALADLAATVDAPETEVTFRSFELSPDTPVDFEGSEVDFLAAHKRMPRQQVDAMLTHVTGVARDAGLTYDFDALRHTNTVQAHELLHFAKAHGRQHELTERLMAAYFTEGRHLGQIDELVAQAVAVGLDGDAARAALTEHTYLEDVRRDQAQARAYGIDAVPFFVIDGKYGVSGAQAPEGFLEILQKVQQERAGA